MGQLGHIVCLIEFGWIDFVYTFGIEIELLLIVSYISMVTSN